MNGTVAPHGKDEVATLGNCLARQLGRVTRSGRRAKLGSQASALQHGNGTLEKARIPLESTSDWIVDQNGLAIRVDSLILTFGTFPPSFRIARRDPAA